MAARGPVQMPELKVVIAYDDFANGRCALNFYEQLVESFGSQFTFEAHFLKFEELLSPEFRARWTAEVAGADMIVITAHEGGELPALFKEWIRSWTPRKTDGSTALIALVNMSGETASRRTPVRSHLHEVAKAKGMEFISRRVAWSGEEVRRPTIPVIAKSA
jgi:hypothetical protein